MNKTLIYFIGAALVAIFIVRILQNLKTKPGIDFQGGQGIIFKGLYAYGRGTQRNCDMLLANETKKSCERSNKDNNFSSNKAEPISADLAIEDKNGNREKQVHADGSENFKIDLGVGYHKICASYQGTNHCAGVNVIEGKYTDFGLPIMRQ